MRIADPSPAKEDPKPQISGMGMKPASPEKVVDEDKDPKIPTLD